MADQRFGAWRHFLGLGPLHKGGYISLSPLVFTPQFCDLAAAARDRSSAPILGTVAHALILFCTRDELSGAGLLLLVLVAVLDLKSARAGSMAWQQRKQP